MFTNNTKTIANIEAEITYWEAAYTAANRKGINSSFESERFEYWLNALREEEAKNEAIQPKLEMARIYGTMFAAALIFLPVVGGITMAGNHIKEAMQPQIANIK